jgi:hypothetical protein
MTENIRNFTTLTVFLVSLLNSITDFKRRRGKKSKVMIKMLGEKREIKKRYH